MAEQLPKQQPTLRAVIDLSANENPLGPSPAVAAAIQAEVSALHRYPSRDGTRMRNLLANLLLIETDHLLLGNGASELLDVTARTLLQPGDEAIIPVPSFMPYQKVVARCGGRAVTVAQPLERFDGDALLAAVTPRTRLLLLGNPNNPTGAQLSHAELHDLLARLPTSVLVVIDEAYVEYVDDPRYPDTLGLIQQGAQLLVLRSLSKAYGLAGLRIGYAIGAPALINRLNDCCQFYNTNALAQAAACAALQDDQHLARTRALNAEGLQYLSQALTALGARVYPSQTNFMLVDFSPLSEDPAIGELLVRELAQRGVLVKAMGRFGLPHCLRISTGLMNDNRALIEALTTILTQQSLHCAG